MKVDEQFIIEQFAAGFAPPYRGTIYDFISTAPMGKGHRNEHKPFDISTANYLRPVFEAIKDASIRKIVIKAGVKTLKTFVVECAIAWHCAFGSGDIGFYMADIDASKDHGKSRFWDWFWSIPELARKRKDIPDRFGETTPAAYFPDKTLRVWPLNESATQNINLAMAVLSDAFLAGKTGMIGQMIARTTQYRDVRKILIESQGGVEDDDFEHQFLDTDQRALYVSCPLCHKSQPFAWEALRPDNHPVESLRGKYAGMSRGPDEEVILADGSYDESKIQRLTHYRCYHCDGKWEDDGEFGPTRTALDLSAHFVPTRTTALPEHAGFSWPAWINRRLSWGDLMLEYLMAKRLDVTRGNKHKLKQWYQKVAGQTWNDDLSRTPPQKLPMSIYDSKEKIPGELGRIAAIDCQFNLTHLVYQVWAIGDGLPPRLLHYEWVKPRTGLSDEEGRKFCKDRVRELNKQHGIEQQNVMIDAGHRPDLVREWAAEDHVVGRIQVGRAIREKVITYCLLMGDDRVSYRWEHPGRKATLERFKRKEPPVYVDIIKDGKRLRVPVQHQMWSTPSIKEIAVRWRDGDGAPKMQVHEQFLRDSTRDGFWAQMNSEQLLPWKGRVGKFRWDNQQRPNHVWDGWCMIMVRMDQLGLLNNFGPPEEEET